MTVLAVVAALSSGCDRSQPASDAQPTSTPVAAAATQPTGPLNVLLISMDTTRADHLGCYGHPFIRTPNIDRLSAEGVTFLQCTSSAPLTLPSHCSMLTSTHPLVHGARDNGAFFLHPDNLTLPEVLQADHYATAAVIGAFVLNREFGLNQGFDVYDDMYTAPRGEETDVSVELERSAEDVCADALRVLHSVADKPFFLFVHFYDPHQPYAPPERFRAQYAERYVGEIAYVDEQLGRLFAALHELNLDATTLVILTADHGEGRDEHGEDTHATFVYDSTLAVPLIFRCPGRIPAGARINAQVRLVDIAPTVLDLTGLGPERLPDAEGVSLRPLILGERSDLHLAAYSESLFGPLNYGFAPLHAWRADGWKYIQAPQPELYQITVDPGELHNRIADEPERAARMRATLRRSIETAPVVVGTGSAQRSVSDAEMAKLQSLGYVGGGSDGGDITRAAELEQFDAGKLDPKDYKDLILRSAATIGLVRDDDPGAERALRDVIQAIPDPNTGFAWAYRDLAGILIRQARYDEAVEWYRRSLRVCPNDGRTMTALGDTLSKLGRTDEAIAVMEQALTHRPVFAQTHAGLGAAYAARNEPEKAIEHFRAALEIDPQIVYVYPALGRVYAQQGRIPEAIDTFERAIALMPDRAAWRRDLAGLLVSQGADAAVAHYQRILDAHPQDAAAQTGLGDVYAALGRPEDAAIAFRRALDADPDCIPACDALSSLLIERGEAAAAVALLRRGLRASPRHPNMANNLAWALATSPDTALRNGDEAVAFAVVACEATGYQNPNLLDTLAAAYAEAGRFDEAIATVDQALGLLGDGQNEALIATLKAHRERYQNHQPCHGC